MLTDPMFGVAVRVFAASAWLVVCARILHAVAARYERRLMFVVMGFIALLASVGSLCSGLGAAQRAGVLGTAVPPELLAFAANVGAGALAAGALIVLTHYRPPEGAK